MCVQVDEAVMGLSVHTDGDGAGDNPLLKIEATPYTAVADAGRAHRSPHSAPSRQLDTWSTVSVARGQRSRRPFSIQ